MQAAHPVFDTDPGGEHQDGGLLRLAKRRQKREPVNARQHAIEYQKVVPTLQCHVQTIDTVVDDINVVPRFAKPFLEVLGEFDLIFNDQDFHSLILLEIDRGADYKFVIWVSATCPPRLSRVRTRSSHAARTMSTGEHYE